MLETYEFALKNTQLKGPTYFAKTLRKFIEIVKEKSKSKTYFVLVILTDGFVHDMRETLELIVDLSALPASLIIAGIGNEDFS